MWVVSPLGFQNLVFFVQAGTSPVTDREACKQGQLINTKSHNGALPGVSSYQLRNRKDTPNSWFQGSSNVLFGPDNLPPNRLHREHFQVWFFENIFLIT